MESIDDNKPNFVSYKKVLLFGIEYSGKSTFINKLKQIEFQENIEHTKDCKIFI